MKQLFGTASSARRRAGFSLIEVALALVVAGGGMLAIFGVFPISLRQSANSHSDMSEMTFASTVLQVLGGNIRTIDRIDVWNDPESFWNAAVDSTGLPKFSAATTSASMKSLYDSALTGASTSPFSPATTQVAATWTEQTQTETKDNGGENIWYFGAENTEAPKPSNSKVLAVPAQYLIRLAVVRRRTDKLVAPSSDSRWPEEEVYDPNVYVISVVSTDRGFPDVYIREPLYSQEFRFVHRP